MKFTNNKSVKIILSLMLSFFISNLIVVISILIAFKISWTLAILNSILLGLFTIFFSFYFRKWILSWSVLIAVVASLLCGMYARDFGDLQNKKIIKGINITDTILYPNGAGYIFKNALVKTSLGVTYQKTSKGNNRNSVSFYYAAPVVNNEWNLSTKVTVFVVGENLKETKEWNNPYMAGIKAPITFSDEFKKAVNKCIETNNLQAVSNPLILKWVSSPITAIEKNKDNIIETWILWNIVQFAGILFFYVFSLFTSKKNTETKEQSLKETPENKIPTDILLRIIFSFYLFYILLFSLYFSKLNFTLLLPVFLGVISLILYIISVATLQIAHYKEKRSISELLYLFVYPFFVYFLTFFKLDFTNSFLWLFCGLFYFFVIAGGFIFGILLSPVIAKSKFISKREIDIQSAKGEKKAKTGNFLIMVMILIGGFFFSLTFMFLKLIKIMETIEPYKTAIFYSFLILGITLIIKFTYRHSIYNIKKDTNLQNIYNTKEDI